MSEELCNKKRLCQVQLDIELQRVTKKRKLSRARNSRAFFYWSYRNSWVDWLRVTFYFKICWRVLLFESYSQKVQLSNISKIHRFYEITRVIMFRVHFKEILSRNALDSRIYSPMESQKNIV